MREIRKISLIVAVALSSGANALAKDCQNSLLTEVEQIQASVQVITEQFVIPGDFAVGFNRIDKISPTYDQAVEIHELIVQTNTPPEVMEQVFKTILELYDTHRIEDVIEIMHAALENQIQPIQLAQALGSIQKDLLLIRGQLGFEEGAREFTYSQATLAETLALFDIASQHKDLTKEAFQDMVEHIAGELNTNRAFDILIVLQVSLHLEQDVEETVKQIRSIQDKIYVEKRRMGFSADMKNIYQASAEIHHAVTLLSIIDQTNLNEEDLAEGFAKYSATRESPSIDEFVGKLVAQVEAAQKIAKQKQQREQEEALKKQLSLN